MGVRAGRNTVGQLSPTCGWRIGLSGGLGLRAKKKSNVVGLSNAHLRISNNEKSAPWAVDHGFNFRSD